MAAIKFNPYIKRNGEMMMYVNSTTRANVGLSGAGYAHYGKGMTNGKRNTMDNALAVFEENAVEFTGDASHPDFVDCGPYRLFVTDIADVAGHATGKDGAFIIRDGRILDCGEWYEY